MKNSQDESGRLWDVLYMFRFAAQQNREGNSFNYKLFVALPDKGDWTTNEKYISGSTRLQREVTLKAEISATDIDDASPCITIMLPNED